MLPLQMALESRNTKLGQSALTGMQVSQHNHFVVVVGVKSFCPFSNCSLCFSPKQKLLCEDRFMGEEAAVLDQQLLSQMLEAIRVTPSLHEDLQVEVMKVRSSGGCLDQWQP